MSFVSTELSGRIWGQHRALTRPSGSRGTYQGACAVQPLHTLVIGAFLTSSTRWGIREGFPEGSAALEDNRRSKFFSWRVSNSGFRGDLLGYHGFAAPRAPISVRISSHFLCVFVVHASARVFRGKPGGERRRCLRRRSDGHRCNLNGCEHGCAVDAGRDDDR